MKFTHERFGTLEVKELTQRDMEQFSHESREANSTDMGLIEYEGFTVRLALRLGLFVGWSAAPEEVDSMKPNQVKWVSRCLGLAMEDALRVDPLSSSPSPTS